MVSFRGRNGPPLPLLFPQPFKAHACARRQFKVVGPHLKAINLTTSLFRAHSPSRGVGKGKGKGDRQTPALLPCSPPPSIRTRTGGRSGPIMPEVQIFAKWRGRIQTKSKCQTWVEREGRRVKARRRAPQKPLSPLTALFSVGRRVVTRECPDQFQFK